MRAGLESEAGKRARNNKEGRGQRTDRRYLLLFVRQWQERMGRVKEGKRDMINNKQMCDTEKEKE